MITASFFKFKLNIFLDTLIQIFFITIIKLIIFRAELTDISAKKEALSTTCHPEQHECPVLEEHHATCRPEEHERACLSTSWTGI